MHPHGSHAYLNTSRQGGFSLVELMVVLVLLVMLASAALPSLGVAIQKAKDRRVQNELIGDLRLAQSEAKRRGRAVSVTPRALDCQPQAVADHNWSCGWRVFVDDGDGRYNATSDTLIAESDIDIQTTLSSTRSQLSYSPVGTTSYVQTFTIGEQGVAVKVAWVRITAS